MKLRELLMFADHIPRPALQVKNVNTNKNANMDTVTVFCSRHVEKTTRVNS